MNKQTAVLIAEDDEGHAVLIQRNLRRAGIDNPLMVFPDGKATLDYLFQRGQPRRVPGTPYVLLLDIRMPNVDGIEVLRQVKSDPELKKLPVIMVTTTDDPREIDRCHELGCSTYITKPVEYSQFVETIRRLGLFLLTVEVPALNGEKPETSC
jgi:CheY-like chemotaxis protein